MKNTPTALMTIRVRYVPTGTLRVRVITRESGRDTSGEFLLGGQGS